VDWQELIFQELREFEKHERERALREAREDEFDGLEWAGIIAAVVVATMIVGKLDLHSVAGGDRFLSTLLSFVVAIPLVGLTGGVFMVRRTRRGLRKRLAKRRTPF
jgi:cation transport ATPase